MILLNNDQSSESGLPLRLIDQKTVAAAKGINSNLLKWG